MSITNGSLDISLLRKNKNEFILQCQRIIDIVVKYFIKSGMFTYEQYDDVMQSVNEELIRRLPSIERTFDNRVLMTTYMNVVIRNICLRIHETIEEEFEAENLLNEHLILNEDYSVSLHIEAEIERLKWILELYGSQKNKLIICMKIYFNIPVTKTDIIRCFNKSTAEERLNFHKQFGTNYHGTLDSENFNSLAPMVNRQENKSTSGASLLRWTLEHLTKIIGQLNGNPPRRSYTKETFKLLFEHFSQQ